MQLMEKQYGKSKPLLVHTDLKVVDENLQLLHESFLKQQSKHGEYKNNLNVLLLQNFVTGCTMIFNNALLESAMPVPDQVYMHDWWFALVAAAYGEIGFVNKSTVSYRQHQKNVLGSRSWFNKFKNFVMHPKKRIILTIYHAKMLSELSVVMTQDKRQLVDTYANILSTNRFARLKFLLQLDWPISWIKKLIIVSVFMVMSSSIN